MSVWLLAARLTTTNNDNTDALQLQQACRVLARALPFLCALGPTQPFVDKELLPACVRTLVQGLNPEHHVRTCLTLPTRQAPAEPMMTGLYDDFDCGDCLASVGAAGAPAQYLPAQTSSSLRNAWRAAWCARSHR